jgi:hypothetical protein
VTTTAKSTETILKILWLKMFPILLHAIQTTHRILDVKAYTAAIQLLVQIAKSVVKIIIQN